MLYFSRLKENQYIHKVQYIKTIHTLLSKFKLSRGSNQFRIFNKHIQGKTKLRHFLRRQKNVIVKYKILSNGPERHFMAKSMQAPLHTSN